VSTRKELILLSAEFPVVLNSKGRDVDEKRTSICVMVENDMASDKSYAGEFKIRMKGKEFFCAEYHVPALWQSKLNVFEGKAI